MCEWLPISEPELLKRLSMDDEEFEAFVDTLVDSVPRREYEAALLTRALGYPWARPEGPFRLVDGWSGSSPTSTMWRTERRW